MSKNTRKQRSSVCITGYKRQVKALLIIGLFLVVLCLIDPVMDKTTPILASSGKDTYQQVRFESVFSDVEISDMRDRLPEDFESEVFSIKSYSEVLVSEGGNVIGFFSDDSPDQVFDLCTQQLLERGWIKVDSGSSNTASFVKNGGRYTWLVLNSLSTGTETSTVVQIGYAL